MNINSKNNKNRSFSWETNASISFVPMRRMCLLCPIMKKRRFLRASMFLTIDGITLIPKNTGKKSFSYQAKAPISYIQMRRMCIWCPIMTKKEIVMRMHVSHNWRNNIDSKKWRKEKLFLSSQSINVIYPNEENMFIMANHE